MNCIDLMSKRSKIAKLQKESNSDQFASIWGQNDQKCWVTSQIIQNNPKLRKSSNYNELHRFDVKNIKPTQNYKSDLIWMNLHRFDVRTIKTTQNYESDQITMNCIDLMSKRSKIAKLQKQSNYYQFASIWRQNDQKCWVTSQNYKSDLISMNLHRFDVRTIKTTQNYESDQIIMHCIDLTSKRSKKLSYVPKLQKWSNYNELHRFDV